MVNYNLAIEMGSANTVIYYAGLGVVLKEPTCIAMEVKKNKQVVKCVGIEAKKLLGTTNSNVKVHFPIVEGCIKNFELTKLLLAEFLKKLTYGGFIKTKHRIVFIHSCGISHKDKCLFKDLTFSVHLKDSGFLSNGICALVGMGIEETDQQSRMVVNIGAGTTDIEVINGSRIVSGVTIGLGGSLIDVKIGEILRKKYSIILGYDALISIKRTVGSLYKNDISTINVVGVDTYTQERKEIKVHSNDIYPVLASFFNKVAESIETVLTMSTSEVMSSVSRYGVYACGGICNILGVDKFLSKRLGVPVYIDTDPDSTTILGAGTLLNNKVLLNAIINEI